MESGRPGSLPGKAVIDGQEYKGSTAFNYDALCLSDLLSMDEYLASAILLNSQSQIAEFGSRSLLGTGLAMFHTERAAWIECVVLLAQGFANERVSPESRSLFGFMLKHLVGSDKNAGNQLLKTVLAGIDHLHAHIAKLSQIVDAAAPSLPPNPQHSLLVAIGGTATLDDHQGFCEEQLRRLKYAACLLVQRTSISSKDVITLLKRLQQATEPADDYGACAWLVALMRQSPEDTDESIPTMASDSEFLTQSDDAVEKGEWKSLGMRLFVKLAWATYLKGFQPVRTKAL